jgi:hypothetical protein
MTLGKRGHVTRFCVDREELANFLETSSASPLCESPTGAKPGNLFDGPTSRTELLSEPTGGLLNFKVLVHCQDRKIVELLRRTLEVADVRSISIEVMPLKLHQR